MSNETDAVKLVRDADLSKGPLNGSFDLGDMDDAAKLIARVIAGENVLLDLTMVYAKLRRYADIIAIPQAEPQDEERVQVADKLKWYRAQCTELRSNKTPYSSPSPKDATSGYEIVAIPLWAVNAMIDQATTEFAAIRAEERANGWRPIAEAKLDTDYLLWWVGADVQPKAPPSTVRGCVSSHEPGMVWTCGEYRPFAWFKYFRELPSPPQEM